MNKLEMAHEYAMVRLTTSNPKTLDEIIQLSWYYADAMQKEWDERNHVGDSNKMDSEWQPDWSQAPDSACCWFVGGISKNRKAYWSDYIPCYKNDETQTTWSGQGMVEAPMFGYEGKWQDSLRKRP